MRWVFTGGGPWDGKELPGQGGWLISIPEVAVPKWQVVVDLDDREWRYELAEVTTDTATYRLAAGTVRP